MIVAGAAAMRAVPLTDFITGAFRVALAPGELVRAVRIPRPSAAAHHASISETGFWVSIEPEPHRSIAIPITC